MHLSARAARLLLSLALAAVVLLAPGCLVRKLKVIRPGIATTATLQSANLAALIDRLQASDRQIRTLTITTDMEPSLGSVIKGEVSELKDVRGYILLRKPNDIRVIGLYPVVRNRAFDMVSNGNDFQLYVPGKNKFIVGKNQLQQLSPNKLENLRPEHIFDALDVMPPRNGEQPVLENDTDEVHADYVVHMMKQAPGGPLLLYRNVWFDRVNLNVVRQEIFDASGDIVSDARYDKYDNVHGTPFPKQIVIMRPKDEYGVTLNILKVDINAQLSNDKFALSQPAGSELIDLSKPRPAPAAPAAQKPGGTANH